MCLNHLGIKINYFFSKINYYLSLSFSLDILIDIWSNFFLIFVIIIYIKVTNASNLKFLMTVNSLVQSNDQQTSNSYWRIQKTFELLLQTFLQFCFMVCLIHLYPWNHQVGFVFYRKYLNLYIKKVILLYGFINIFP